MSGALQTARLLEGRKETQQPVVAWKGWEGRTPYPKNDLTLKLPEVQSLKLPRLPAWPRLQLPPLPKPRPPAAGRRLARFGGATPDLAPPLEGAELEADPAPAVPGGTPADVPANGPAEGVGEGDGSVSRVELYPIVT